MKESTTTARRIEDAVTVILDKVMHFMAVMTPAPAPPQPAPAVDVTQLVAATVTATFQALASGQLPLVQALAHGPPVMVPPPPPQPISAPVHEHEAPGAPAQVTNGATSGEPTLTPHDAPA